METNTPARTPHRRLLQPFTTYLPAATLTRVQRLSEAEGITAAAFIRRAVMLDTQRREDAAHGAAV